MYFFLPSISAGVRYFTLFVSIHFSGPSFIFIPLNLLNTDKGMVQTCLSVNLILLFIYIDNLFQISLSVSYIYYICLFGCLPVYLLVCFFAYVCVCVCVCVCVACTSWNLPRPMAFHAGFPSSLGAELRNVDRVSDPEERERMLCSWIEAGVQTLRSLFFPDR